MLSKSENYRKPIAYIYIRSQLNALHGFGQGVWDLISAQMSIILSYIFYIIYLYSLSMWSVAETQIAFRVYMNMYDCDSCKNSHGGGSNYGKPIGLTIGFGLGTVLILNGTHNLSSNYESVYDVRIFLYGLSTTVVLGATTPGT